MTTPTTDTGTLQDWIDRCYGAEARVEALVAALRYVEKYLRVVVPKRCGNCRRVPVKFSLSCLNVPSCRTQAEMHDATAQTTRAALRLVDGN